MLMTTQDELAGYQVIETLGIVRGNTVRARHLGQDILAGFRNVVGGEVVEYSNLLAEAREQAVDRMIQRARELGADAIVCVRFMTSSIMQNASEILVFGTAVKIQKSEA